MEAQVKARRINSMSAPAEDTECSLKGLFEQNTTPNKVSVKDLAAEMMQEGCAVDRCLRCAFMITTYLNERKRRHIIERCWELHHSFGGLVSRMLRCRRQLAENATASSEADCIFFEFVELLYSNKSETLYMGEEIDLGRDVLYECLHHCSFGLRETANNRCTWRAFSAGLELLARLKHMFTELAGEGGPLETLRTLETLNMILDTDCIDGENAYLLHKYYRLVDMHHWMVAPFASRLTNLGVFYEQLVAKNTLHVIFQLKVLSKMSALNMAYSDDQMMEVRVFPARAVRQSEFVTFASDLQLWPMIVQSINCPVLSKYLLNCFEEYHRNQREDTRLAGIGGFRPDLCSQTTISSILQRIVVDRNGSGMLLFAALFNDFLATTRERSLEEMLREAAESEMMTGVRQLLAVDKPAPWSAGVRAITGFIRRFSYQAAKRVLTISPLVRKISSRPPTQSRRIYFSGLLPSISSFTGSVALIASLQDLSLECGNTLNSTDLEAFMGCSLARVEGTPGRTRGNPLDEELIQPTLYRMPSPRQIRYGLATLLSERGVPNFEAFNSVKVLRTPKFTILLARNNLDQYDLILATSNHTRKLVLCHGFPDAEVFPAPVGFKLTANTIPLCQIEYCTRFNVLHVYSLELRRPIYLFLEIHQMTDSEYLFLEDTIVSLSDFSCTIFHRCFQQPAQRTYSRSFEHDFLDIGPVSKSQLFKSQGSLMLLLGMYKRATVVLVNAETGVRIHVPLPSELGIHYLGYSHTSKAIVISDLEDTYAFKWPPSIS